VGVRRDDSIAVGAEGDQSSIDDIGLPSDPEELPGRSPHSPVQRARLDAGESQRQPRLAWTPTPDLADHSAVRRRLLPGLKSRPKADPHCALIPFKSDECSGVEEESHAEARRALGVTRIADSRSSRSCASISSGVISPNSDS